MRYEYTDRLLASVCDPTPALIELANNPARFGQVLNGVLHRLMLAHNAAGVINRKAHSEEYGLQFYPTVYIFLRAAAVLGLYPPEGAPLERKRFQSLHARMQRLPCFLEVAHLLRAYIDPRKPNLYPRAAQHKRTVTEWAETSDDPMARNAAPVLEPFPKRARRH